MSDPLVSAIHVASSGLIAQSARMRVASENMANAYSTGRTPGEAPYARKTIDFSTEIDELSGAERIKTIGVERSAAPFRLDFNPGHPAADSSGNVKMPNIDPLIELGDVREAQRSYMANLQIIKQARDAISMTIDLLRG